MVFPGGTSNALRHEQIDPGLITDYKRTISLPIKFYAKVSRVAVVLLYVAKSNPRAGGITAHVDTFRAVIEK